MAQNSLNLGPVRGQAGAPVKEQSYWRSVAAKLWRDKITVAAMGILLVMVLLALGAPWVATYGLGFSPTITSLRERNDPPTWAASAWPKFQEFTRSCHRPTGCEWSLWRVIGADTTTGLVNCWRAGLGHCHWMGTDQAGRDVLTRGFYGGRISLRIGFWVAAVAMSLGVVMGLISGYYAATAIDDLVNAIIMIFESIPTLFLLIILSHLFQPGPEGLAILLGLFGWTGTSRLLRGQIFVLREREFIVASRAVGSTSWRIIGNHIFPNVASLVIVAAVFEVAGAILVEAGLSYLGVGIGPPLASWGNMMQGSLGNFTDAPWLVLAPGSFIFLTTLAIYLIGDGLRDALDPWIKQ